MSEFPANPARHDPYKRYRFLVKWDGKIIAGISRVSGLERSVEVIGQREAGSSNTDIKSPGLILFAPITLTRGVTQDTAFEDWANLAGLVTAGTLGGVMIAELRKKVAIELQNEAGQIVKRYLIHRCWPSRYQALSDLDANDGCALFETLVLENEGWERDRSLVEQVDP